MIIYPTCMYNLLSEGSQYFGIVEIVSDTELNKKHTLFFDVTPCSLADMHQCVGGTCCSRLGGRVEEYCTLRWGSRFC
jgi:hypothetical protein